MKGTTTTTLTPEAIKEIIAEKLSNNGRKVKASDVEFKMTTETVGFYKDERQVKVFNGAEVTVRE